MPNSTIGLRIPSEDRELLDTVCNLCGESLSNFVRRAIRKELAELSYYPEAVKKALGVLDESAV